MLVQVHLLIVCAAAARDQVNTAFGRVDPASVGDVMGPPVRLATGTDVVGYGAGFGMDIATRQRLNTAVREAPWSPRPTRGEQTPIPVGGAVPAWGLQRVYVFDDGWDYDTALAALGLARVNEAG